jgi:CBS domain containing-hemolysin-like protein
MPVWDGDPDNIVGIVNTKNIFHLFSLKGVVILMDAMYEPTFVPPDMSVAGLLRFFKRRRRPMAIVQSDDGKFLGIVTLEDILEEIVGEIEDEHDTPSRGGVTDTAGHVAAPGSASATGAGPLPAATVPGTGATPAAPAPPAAPPLPAPTEPVRRP